MGAAPTPPARSQALRWFDGAGSGIGGTGTDSEGLGRANDRRHRRSIALRQRADAKVRFGRQRDRRRTKVARETMAAPPRRRPKWQGVDSAHVE
jgi:hypothetical protein